MRKVKKTCRETDTSKRFAVYATCLNCRARKIFTEGAPLEIDGVLFSLLYGDRANPDAILGYCDFGEISPGKELDISSRLQLFQTLPSFTSSMGKGRLGRILDRHIWNNPGLTSSSGSASTASRFTFKFNAPSKVPEKWKRPEPQIPAWTAQKTQHDLAEKLNKEIRAIHKAVPETTLQEHNEELRKAAAGISELELEQMLALRGQLDDIKDTFGPLASPASLDMRNEVLRNVKILEQQADQRRSLVREMLKQAEGSSGGGIHQSRWGKIRQAHTQQDRQRDALAKISMRR